MNACEAWTQGAPVRMYVVGRDNGRLATTLREVMAAQDCPFHDVTAFTPPVVNASLLETVAADAVRRVPDGYRSFVVVVIDSDSHELNARVAQLVASMDRDAAPRLVVLRLPSLVAALTGVPDAGLVEQWKSVSMGVAAAQRLRDNGIVAHVVAG